jgi:hypothetical protein
MAKSRPRSTKKRSAKRGRAAKGPTSAYYVQPGKRGAVIVLRKPCGNRVTPKVCGVMPSRGHAKALVETLERAETAVNDLFYEATDDGIEALEAVLAACREAVLKRMPVSASRAEALQQMETETGDGGADAPGEPPA